jgi:hypothetical protein
MAEPTHTLERLLAGVQAQTESRFTAVVERKPIDVVELEDVNFHFNSAVLLPIPPTIDGPTTPGQGRVTGLCAIAMALKHGANAPGAELLIAGHTDSVGSAGANRALSELRANNVRAYLEGDAAAWAPLCERHVVADYQLILTWVAREHGLPCDPGGVDGAAGPRTNAALDRFRAGYNARFDGSLPERGPIGSADWEAFFALYDRSLADLLECDVGDLPSKRSALTWMSPPVLACGETFPIDNVGRDNVRSQTNRRVELLFIEDPAHPTFAEERPPGASIYGTPARYQRVYLEVENLSAFKFSV